MSAGAWRWFVGPLVVVLLAAGALWGVDRATRAVGSRSYEAF